MRALRFVKADKNKRGRMKKIKGIKVETKEEIITIGKMLELKMGMQEQKIKICTIEDLVTVINILKEK